MPKETLLARIQKSPEHIKQRWVVGTSIFATILVVFLWAMYFDNLMQGMREGSDKKDSARVALVMKAIGEKVRSVATGFFTPPVQRIK